jgi:hypothetical protein
LAFSELTFSIRMRHHQAFYKKCKNICNKEILWQDINYSWCEIWTLNKIFHNISIVLKYLNSVTHSVILFVLFRMLDVFSLLLVSFELIESLQSNRTKIYKILFCCWFRIISPNLLIDSVYQIFNFQLLSGSISLWIVVGVGVLKLLQSLYKRRVFIHSLFNSSPTRQGCIPVF